MKNKMAGVKRFLLEKNTVGHSGCTYDGRLHAAWDWAEALRSCDYFLGGLESGKSSYGFCKILSLGF